MVDKIIKDFEFLDDIYFPNLAIRLVYSSFDLEDEIDNMQDPLTVLKIDAQAKALKYILDENATECSHISFLKYVCDIASYVTCGEVDNFRHGSILVNGSNVKRTRPEMIRAELLNLIDDVNYLIKQHELNIEDKTKTDQEYEMELFKIAALFHIRFLRIHPFEDGNGRTARILLAKMLIDNGAFPCIIDSKNKRQYCDYIEKNDIDGMAQFLKELSHKENENASILYTNYEPHYEIQEKVYTKAKNSGKIII